MSDLSITDSNYIEPQQYDAGNQAQESVQEPEPVAEQNIFVQNPITEKKNAYINLNDYYSSSSYAIAFNKINEATDEIAKEIANQLEISYKEGEQYSKEFENAMSSLYQQNKDDFDIYERSLPAGFSENMSTQEILEALAHMTCDGTSSDDDILVEISKEQNINFDNFNNDEIDTIEDTTDEITEDPIEEIVIDNKEEPEDDTKSVDDSKEEQNDTIIPDTTQDKNVVTKQLGIFNASKGTSDTINMDNYYYKGGKFSSAEEAEKQLASDLMDIYSINKNDTNKSEKLEQACADILAKNSCIQPKNGETNLQAILRIGNDGINNDYINVTRHPEDEKTVNVPTTRKYDKTTGEILSDETESEYIEYSKDKEGNKIANVYSKQNGVKSDKADKVITYDKEDKIVKEETNDSVTTYTQEQSRKLDATKREKNGSGHMISYEVVYSDVYVKNEYKKDENGTVSDVPYKTTKSDENGRTLYSSEQIDENTKEIKEYYYEDYKEDDLVSPGDHAVTTEKIDSEGQKTAVETVYNSNNEVKSISNKSYDKDGNLSSKTVNNKVANTISRYDYGDKDSEYQAESYFDYNADGIVDETFKWKKDGTTEYTFLDIDHKIDSFKQENIKFCWGLSGMISSSSSDIGQALLDDSFVKNDDGTYTMNFKGVNKKIDVTPEDLEDARAKGCMQGDSTALLITVGFNKLLHDMKNNPQDYNSYDISANARNISNMVYYSNPKSDDDILIDGGLLSDFTYVLFGKKADYTYSSLRSNIDCTDFDNTAAYLTFSEKYDWTSSADADHKSKMVKDINGQNCELMSLHAYAVVGANKQDGTITIVNPHNSSISYTFYADELESYCSNVRFEYCNLKD